MILTGFGEADGKENKLYIGKGQSLEIFDCSVGTSVGYINFGFTQSQIQLHGLMDQIWLMGYHVKKPGTKMWKCACALRMWRCLWCQSELQIGATDFANHLTLLLRKKYVFSLQRSGAGIYKYLHCFQTYSCMTQIASFTPPKLWTNKLYRLKKKNKIWMCLQR